MLAGCSDTGYTDGDWSPALEAHYIYSRLDNMRLGAEANSSARGNVSAESTSWRFTTPADWLSVSPMSGNTDAQVTFTAKTDNPSGADMRTSVFALESAEPSYKYSHPVSVTQASSNPFLDVTIDGQAASSMLIDTGTSVTRTIDVSSNIKWNVASSESWCHASATADGRHINVTVDDNTSLSSRSALLTISSDVFTRQVEVIQSGSNVRVSEDVLSFDCSGGKYTIDVSADLPWTASSTGDSWLTINPSSGGVGITNVTISAETNASVSSRMSLIDFLMGTNKAVTIRVNQGAMSISVDKDILAFEADSQQQTLTVTSNTAWQLYDVPSWITVSRTSGTGNATLTLTAAEYWGTKDRSAVITVGNNDVNGLSQTVTVTQKARDIKPMRSLLLDADATSDTVHVNISRAWTATPQGDAAEWISVSPASATGAAVLTVSVTENMDATERSGSILVKADELSTFISVTQRGKYFDVSPTSASLPQTGGTHTITISTNNSWTARRGSSWMHLSATSGRGDAELKLTADANKSTLIRQDTTMIEPVNMQSIRIITAQEALYLHADNTSLTLSSKGGRSNTVIITTNASYMPKADYAGAAPWFTIVEDGKTFAVIADENTSEDERTGKVIITLFDVPDNDPGRIVEIPVIQRGKKAGVDVDPFGPDQVWEIRSDGSVTIRVTGFKEDKNLDETGKTNAGIPVTDFGEDKNWDY